MVKLGEQGREDIYGHFLSNLRFAGDIFLCTETQQELQQMLQELSDESRRMGLKMNIATTKVMVIDNTPINVNNVLIENVQGYVYLGEHYSIKEKNQDKDIQRRIMAGSTAYAKHRDVFKGNFAICLKRQVYNSSVLPAMKYGEATCTLTKQGHNKLAAAQTKMERIMLNITYKDRKTNIGVRERTTVIHPVYNQHCEKNEMVLDRAYNPPQRRSMDLACHHLEAIRQEKTTREASQAVERRPGQILERHDMAEIEQPKTGYNFMETAS